MSGSGSGTKADTMAERDQIATALAERGISHLAKLIKDEELGWIVRVWVSIADARDALYAIIALGVIGFDLRVTHGGAASLEAAVVGEQKCLCGALLPPGKKPMALEHGNETSVGREVVEANTCVACHPVAMETGDLRLAAAVSKSARAALAQHRAVGAERSDS